MHVAMLMLVLALAGDPAPLPDTPLASPHEEKNVLPPLPSLEPRGVFVGEKWRYRQGDTFGPWVRDFVLRILADIVAVPTSVVRWEPGDYLTFGLAVGIPVGFSVPVNGRSLDSRITLAIHDVRGGPNCGYAQANSAFCPAPPTPPRFWTLLSDDIIMAVTMGAPALMLGISALVDGAEPFVEASALALEALAVTQVYHISLKFLTGREGPLARDAR